MKGNLPRFLQRAIAAGRRKLSQPLSDAVSAEAEIRTLASTEGWPILKAAHMEMLMMTVELVDTASERAMALDIGQAKGIVKIIRQYQAIEKKQAMEKAQTKAEPTAGTQEE